MPFSLSSYLASRQRLVDRALEKMLPAPRIRPFIIHKAMRYSVTAGGKRLRPILVIAAAELCGGKAERVMPTACAMELIHNYSLVHDDLPAMDDDDLRRGRPTNHRVFGEDMAILAGDGLLTHAFTLIASNAKIRGVSAAAVVEATRLISEAAGTFGMVGGQVADIQSDGGRWKKLRGKEFPSVESLLEFIHMKKTAALIVGSLEAGAVLAGANRRQISALSAYGEAIGLAFQVQDDILDRVGDKKKLGKRGSDAENEKLTYPAVYGIEASRLAARELVHKAHRALGIFGRRAEPLHALADFIIARDH